MELNTFCWEKKIQYPYIYTVLENTYVNYEKTESKFQGVLVLKQTYLDFIFYGLLKTRFYTKEQVAR